jgi:peptide/nickel transport system substrate-binding protein
MDPPASVDNNAGEIIQETNMPLVFCGSQDCNTLIPVLASSWKTSPDGLTYTFILRNGIYFNNGDPLNSYVVWWNIYRSLIMNQGAAFVLYLYFNASGVTAGDLNSFNNVQNSPQGNQTLLSLMENPANSVTVLNSTAIQFHLTNPYVSFLKTIPCSCWAFSDPPVVEQHGGVVANQPNAWMAVNGTLIGDGPYITQTFVPNQYTILVKNPNYWGVNYTDNLILKPAAIPKIVINYKTDELTRTLDLENNKAQVSIVTFNDVKNVLSGRPNLYVPSIGLSGTPEFVGIDTQRYPTNITLVRQAIVEAINVSQIEEIVYGGYSVPLVGPTPHGMFYYNESITPPSYNVTDAKRLLVEAGFPNGNGIPQLNFVYPNSAYLSLAAQIIKQDLAQIGITLIPQQVGADTYLSLLAIPGSNLTAPYMASASWTYYPDFSAYEYIIAAQFGLYNFLNNATIYNWILTSNDELNTSLRAQEISQITNAVQLQAAFVWLGQDVDLYPVGGGFGPEVWNHCLAGQWYSPAFDGPDFNSIYYNCTAG